MAERQGFDVDLHNVFDNVLRVASPYITCRLYKHYVVAFTIQINIHLFNLA